MALLLSAKVMLSPLPTAISVPPVVFPTVSISAKVSTVSTCASTYAWICACVASPAALFDTAPVTILNTASPSVPLDTVSWSVVFELTLVISPGANAFHLVAS